MRILTHDDVLAALTPAEAVDALRATLRGGYDPAADQPRTKVPLHRGEMQLLPSALPRVAGVKILSIQPEDHDPALPLVQGQYLLFDGPTLTPHSLLDGSALTSLRTPAVSLAGVKDFIVGCDGALRVVIVGTGAQGRGHAAAVESVVGAEGASISFVGRTPRELGHPWLAAGSAEARAALREADLVVCATTSREPILGLEDVRGDAVVVAVGSHTTDARELAADLVGAAHVIVEDPGAALREAGDVTLAIAEGALAREDLIPMKDVVSNAVEVERDRPIVFKTVGMPWEDLVVADAVVRSAEAR